MQGASIIFIFFSVFYYFYANVQRNLTYKANMQNYITTEFKFVKRGDSRFAAFNRITALPELFRSDLVVVILPSIVRLLLVAILSVKCLECRYV